MSIANRGSIYDKILDEKWFNTPDMGEYWNNAIYKKKADGQSETKGKTEFFVENPPTLESGYHKDLGVVCLRVNPKTIYNELGDKESVNLNFFDGDTIFLNLDDVSDTQSKFQVDYSQTIFQGVRHYLKETLSLNDIDDKFKLRFLGIDAPETAHYSQYLSNLDNSDIYITTYSKLKDNNTYVPIGNKNFNKKQFFYRDFTTDANGEIVPRKDTDSIQFLKVKSYKSGEDDELHEIVTTSNVDKYNRKVRTCVVKATNGKDLEYHKKAKVAQKKVLEAFGKATEACFILDTVGLNGKKSDLPYSYKKSFEKSTTNPFYSLYDMWKSMGDEAAAYKYSGYRVPGQEANGRFLAAIYLKIDGQWINLNKKQLFESEETGVVQSHYTESVDDLMNHYFSARGLKMWTYDLNNQLFVDSISDEVLKTKDDRKEIQSEIAGCDLEEMKSHTVMIGDCLFMIPPTSIRAVSQTRTAKTPLLRAKGSMDRTIPKTQRLIQMELYFCGAEGINGIPYNQKLPNGTEKTYYMNGLRSLIAMFKLAPIQPIHNSYINDTLCVQAVSLTNYTLETVPNFPRAIKATITLQEFDWVQVMPCQAIPANQASSDLYKNGFSETMHFPLLRYHYQKALERGHNLKFGDFQNIAPNNVDYIKQTLGNRTALQPMEFSDSLIDFYVPNQNLLAQRKQALVEMKTKPLGKVFDFSKNESQWISKCNPLNKFINDAKAICAENFSKMTGKQDSGLDTFFKVGKLDTEQSYDDILNGNTSMIYYGKNKYDREKDTDAVVKKYIVPTQGDIATKFNDFKTDLDSMIHSYEIRTKTERVKDNDKVNHNFFLSFTVHFNNRFFEEESSLQKIREYCAKQLSLEAKNIFPGDSMTFYFKSNFVDLKLAQPFELDSKSDEYSASLKALGYLAALTDSAQEGFEDFDMNQTMEDLKASIDLENENSMKFELFDMGTPIVTSISTSYNNIFTQTSLKATDGFAGQYCGGTDASLELVMIGDEYAAGQAYFLNRLCTKYLIDYRKIMKSSPLRIDSDFTRMIGMYEVIIDSVDVVNVPNTTNRFEIKMSLSSVDRTLRNRESLKRIKGVDDSTVQEDLLINAQNYFNINKFLGKAELYPDLELPTLEELEKDGFYFLQSKYQPERTYPDPDFYFLYWYPTLANNIKTALVDFFDNPDNFDYEIADDFSNESFNLNINMGDDADKTAYKVTDWKDRNKSYDERVKSLKELAKELCKDKNGEKLDDDDAEDFSKSAISVMKKNEEIDEKLKSLQEILDNSVYNCFQVNTLTSINVKDVELVDTLKPEERKEKDELNKKLKDIIKEALDKECVGKAEDGKEFNPELFFKPRNGATFNSDLFKVSNSSPVYDDGSGTSVSENINSDGAAYKIFCAIFGEEVDKDKLNKSFEYIINIIKAGACGSMASTGIFNVSDKLVNNGYAGDAEKYNAKEEPLCYPPNYSTISNKKGEKENVPICLYPDSKTSELLIAHDEETRKLGTIFGRFGIKKFPGKQIAKMFKLSTGVHDGFLDPYYNADIHQAIFGKNLSSEDEESRVAGYREKICKDVIYAFNAYYRQMLVWLWILIDQDVLVNIAHLYCNDLIKASNEGSSSWWEGITNFFASIGAGATGGFGISMLEKEAITGTNAIKAKKDGEKFDQIVGEGSYSNIINSSMSKKDKVDELRKLIKKNSYEYCSKLVTGIFYTLSAITMSGFDSSILRAVCNGDMGAYSNAVSEGVGQLDYSNLTEEEKRISRFAQYCNYCFDEDERNLTNPIQHFSYNNRVQRAYLKAANDPKVYMLHSFYDMVMNDKRGSMARAFPTYYMLLIDEGRRIGYWKLQDNFYDMNSIIEFEVVKSRKMAADTARIQMTNMYGTFTTDDSDMKDEYEYSMSDVFNSIFSPRTYFKEEYMRRKHARDINSANLQPGARVHLRMGYGSNAATLPIVFNGCVTEFETGETVTLLCQGDGVELANPNMFNSLDAKDVQDLAASDKFFGLKQIIQTWSNLSTPRDMLVLPLVVEGTWIQELVRKYSSGRFFNSNPFGIVHFGDRKFRTIFPTNGEVEQNIYEGLSRPSLGWDGEELDGLKDLDTIESEYSLSEAPRVRVSLSNGTSYWDIMHIAASLSPDFICAVAPFQMRSTIFHGAPRYYYAYDYMNIDGHIMEKRKPFQQYHIYTSYSDIIDNKMIASAKEVRTNAVGHYVGPGWVTKKVSTVGPLFVDIDIFPENQQSTTVNLNFEYKNNDILPFNVPIVDKTIDMFDWTDGPDGHLTAWRATASKLKDCMKDMYGGELIVMGDPTVKPHDRCNIQDSYEDMGGAFEVEQVVHMFSNDTGFTTSIKPDLISAIDNKFETRNNAIITQSLLPAFLTTLTIVATNLNFHNQNRPTYLAIAKAAKKGGNFVTKAVNNAINTVGKSDIQRDAHLIKDNIKNSKLKAFLQIDESHIALSNKLDEILSASRKIKSVNLKGSKSLVKILDGLSEAGDVFETLNKSSIEELDKMLNTDAIKNTGALDAYDKASLINSIEDAKKHLTLSKKELETIKSGLSELSKTDDAAKALYELIDTSKDLNMTGKQGKEFLDMFKKVASGVDNLSSDAEFLKSAKVIAGKSDNIAKALKEMEGLKDVGKLALTAKSAMNVISAIASSTILFAVDLYISKGVQEFITRKLRNLQVLTLYPLKKDGVVWTAGINGHQGSVVGSPAYNEPGWLEEMAIKFFDYGNNADDNIFRKSLGFIRDMLLTTDEMREIVDGYKRGNNYTVKGQSKDKQRTEATDQMLDDIAKRSALGYVDYKQIYMYNRLSMKDISDRNVQANQAYAYYKIQNIDDIEQTLEISKNLRYVLSDALIKKLYENKCFILANDFDTNDISTTYKNATLERKHILVDTGNEKQSDYVYVKKIGNNNPPVYDIPYLRNDALIVLKNICQKIESVIQPDYGDAGCKFDKLKEHPIIFHSGTLVNSDSGWRSTGYLFTIEVKNYDNFSNIISSIESERDTIMKACKSDQPFTVSKDDSSKYGANTYSVFVHCPKV